MLTVRCRIVAQSTFLDFLREQLPPPPARVLDVGCGQGELTTALAVEGYDVLGIDPLAPEAERFRRIRLEDLEPDEGPFDAVVASHSLHHVRDLGQALDRIVALLVPGGLLVLDEHGWDLADEATLDWLYEPAARARGRGARRCAGLARGAPRGVGGRASRPPRLRDAAARELDARFDERAFVRAPFLHRLLGGRRDRGARAGADRRGSDPGARVPLRRRRPPRRKSEARLTRIGDGR